VAVFNEKYADGWPDTKIADLIGCSSVTVRYRRNALGLPANAAPGGFPRSAVRPGWGLTGFRGQHLDALRAAGWSWPLFDGRGDAVDLTPLAVRVLLVLFRDGPKTRRQIVEAMGIEYRHGATPLKSGYPSRDALLLMEGRGLVERAGRAPRSGDLGSTPTDRFAVTDAALGLLCDAAANNPAPPDRTLSPADVLKMCGFEA
jgi:hypothetical protein